MQKLKYLIILALGILLTLVYVQLDDYDNISNSLLDDNIKANQSIEKLQETILILENNNENLQEDIIFLHNKIDNLILEIEYLENQRIQDIFQMENNSTDNNVTDINGSIPTEFNLENENSITGFGADYE